MPAATPTAGRLIDCTLDLIDESGGCRGVNLRQVAQRAGCAHTNVYNYHGSLEDLLWAALDAAAARLAQLTEARLKNAGRDRLREFLEAQMDFALAHPGWFRLIWLEPLAGTIPKSVLDRLMKMRASWIGLLAGCPPDELEPAVADRFDTIVHGYFHGELCKLISGRTANGEETSRARIIENVKLLADWLGSGSLLRVRRR